MNSHRKQTTRLWRFRRSKYDPFCRETKMFGASLPVSAGFLNHRYIDYLKTVEFLISKTSQCKKGNNTDSKKYTLSVQCLHRSLIFYILKFNMNFQVTIIGSILYYKKQITFYAFSVIFHHLVLIFGYGLLQRNV